jgi:hypothetical protein
MHVAVKLAACYRRKLKLGGAVLNINAFLAETRASPIHIFFNPQ